MKKQEGPSGPSLLIVQAASGPKACYTPQPPKTVRITKAKTISAMKNMKYLVVSITPPVCSPRSLGISFSLRSARYSI